MYLRPCVLAHPHTRKLCRARADRAVRAPLRRDRRSGGRIFVKMRGIASAGDGGAG
jgi:hypothetical protein